MRTRIIILIVSIISLIILGSAGYFYYTSRHMLIVKIQPSLSNVPDGEISTATTYIDFYFNKKINTASIKPDSIFSDQSIIKSIEVNNQSIRVHTQNLSRDQKYSIYFKNIQSDDGYILNNYTYTVTAAFINNYQATKAEQAAQNAQTDHNNNSDPVFAIVPYQTLDYSITAAGTITTSQTPVTISIFINLTAADYNDPHPETIIETKRQLARNYLIAKGIDLKKYTIIYSQTPNNYAN